MGGTRDTWRKASLALDRTGESEVAGSMLDDAERLIRRARINGVDDPGIYYSEGVLLVLRNLPDEALQKLQLAYERGFREQWMLEVDSRLDPLRDRPEFLVFKERIDDDLNRARAEISSLALASL